MLVSFVSASSSRFRPLLTSLRKLPCGFAFRRSCSGSGLTANRINQSNASGLYPAFDRGSCSSRPALSYRPLLTLADLPRGYRCDPARAPDAAPTGKTSERVKERLCFYSFHFFRQSNLRFCNLPFIKRVQPAHRRVSQELCNRCEACANLQYSRGFFAAPPLRWRKRSGFSGFGITVQKCVWGAWILIEDLLSAQRLLKIC